jgi:hypothetical protein
MGSYTSFTANILTNTNNFVTAQNGGGIGGPDNTIPGTYAVHTDRTASQGASTWETLSFAQGPQTNQFGLQTSDGFFLTAEQGGGIPAAGNSSDQEPIQTNRTVPQAWEQFTLNFLPALSLNSPYDALSGQWVGYTVTPAPPDQKVTVQVDNTNYLTVVKNEDTGLAISSDRTKMLDWETFTLDNIALPDAFSFISVEVGTGGDNLRNDSAAIVEFFAINQLQPGPGVTNTPFFSQTLKAENGGEWKNNTSATITYPLPNPIPGWVFGSIVITLIEHPGGLEDWDNWDIQNLLVNLYNLNSEGQVTNSQVILSGVPEPTLSDGSTGIARLTNSTPTLTVLFANKIVTVS